MKRETAIELLDRLNDKGYTVRLLAIPKSDKFFIPNNPNEDGRQYRVEVAEIGVDKVDLREFVTIADDLDLDVGTHRLDRGVIAFTEPDRTPAVVVSPRRHPR